MYVDTDVHMFEFTFHLVEIKHLSVIEAPVPWIFTFHLVEIKQ